MGLLRACDIKQVDLIVAPAAQLGTAADHLKAVATRRLAREPLSRIFGRREFWTFDLELCPQALDPRPDTETLIDAVLEIFAARQRDAPLRVLDLGVGSGAILCALLTEFPRAEGLGSDISSYALDCARRNLRALSLSDRAQIQFGDWMQGVDGRFDIIISNPPYIPTTSIAHLEPEVNLHDPRLALDGGTDGMDAYRAILPQAAAALTLRGVVFVEIGEGQAPHVIRLARAAGLRDFETRLDLSGIERVVLARPPAE